MRVIAGRAKGRLLKSPASPGTRPTSGRVRGAVFSSLQSLVPSFPRVLDLYAGTGALGIEALSRSAVWVDFVEQSPRLCALIRDNLRKLELSEQGHVYCASVSRALSFLAGPYDLIFADPPYDTPRIAEAMTQVCTSALAGPETTVVLETASRHDPIPELGPFRLVRELRHGDTRVSIYQRNGGRSPSGEGRSLDQGHLSR